MTKYKNNKKTKVAIIIFLITAIIVIALTAVLAFGEKNEGYRTITVIEIGGTVGVVHGNMEYAAYTGMHLEEGYTVVTNGNSYVRLLLDDDKYVKLESGTKAVFSEVSGGKTAIDIERGALVAEVTKPLQLDEDFIVNTPNAVLAVRGTLFRVDLSRNDKGELNTDVMTYGGAVSSKRIQPSGEVEDIEVTIKEGFKATVNMDDKETVYLVDEVKVDLSALVGKPSGNNKPNNTTTETDINGDVIENTPITLESVLMPIVVEDIPDDDLVDIYFASENGHSMFIETKEIKTKIEERNIDIAEKTPVYEVAQRVVEPVEVVIPDDNKPLLTTTEVETEQIIAVQGTPNDGGVSETTTELATVPSTTVPTTTVPTTTVPTTTVPTTTVPTTTVPSTTAPTTTVTTTESTTVPATEPTTEITTTETTVHTHTEVTEEVKATCIENGLKTVKCSDCGEIISETVLTATGHTEILSGTKDAHSECSVCYEILSADHTYQSSTTNASCTLDGGTTYVCECGYNYTDVIPADGHTEVYAGNADIHTKCSVCGETLTDGTSHSYNETVTQPNSCTTVGELTSTCVCGWSYTEEIPAGHVKSTDGTTCSGCGGVWVDLNSTNFPDSMFLSYISTTYDADGNSALIGSEVTGVVTINVSGDSSTDGGYTDLTGINKLPNLTTVNCAYNSGVTELDLSGLTELVSLNITGLTNLQTLNVSGCTDLTESNITGLETCTALTTLDVSGCTAFTTLSLDANNKLKTVNLSGCSNLTSFAMADQSKQYFLESIDLTGCSKLESITVSSTSLTSVDFTDATSIKTIDLGGCQGITGTLDVSNKTSLTTLTIGSLKISSLNITGCTALTTINATACTNLATIVGTSSCTNLSTLTLVNTGLTSLDLEENSALAKLNVMHCTALTNLNLTRKTESTTFYSLTVTGCTALKTLNLYNCKGLTSLVTTPLTALEELNLGYSGVTTFNSKTDTMNFSSNTNLKRVYLNDISSFTSVDISSNTLLEEFSLTSNSNVTSLDFSTCTGLKILTLSDATALTTLNIDNCNSLESLNVMNTGLASLSVTGSSSLTQLYVYSNSSLTSLGVTGASSLTSIKLSSNASNTVLQTLSITECGLTSLDVSGFTALNTLDLTGTNNISTLDVTNAGSTNSSFNVSITIDTTTAVTVPLATGWNSSYMTFTEI